jgi:ribonucleoside-diphosphate reductase alpha chain
MAKTKKIKIKDLQIGTKIKTRDKDGRIVFKNVTDKFNTIVSSENQILLRFANLSKLNCSTNHPILILGDGGEFIEKLPMDISYSDQIITDSGVTNLLSIENCQRNDENYIDITVEDCHTFFASDTESGEMILTHNSQGGLRKGSATLFFPIWHQEIKELIVLKNEKGNDENRARSLDYAVSISKLFYERYIKNEEITLFSPNDVPGLYDAFGTDKFDDLYVHYERDESIPKKTVSAQELILEILNERSDTGRIYILNIDHANSHSPYLKTIRMSNLCVEICLLTDPIEHIDDTNGAIALCILSALNSGIIKSEKELEECCDLVVRSLDELIDIQEYPVKVAEISTRKYRPLGVGIIGLAHYLAKLGFKYDDPEACNAVHKLSESLQYYLLKASNQLAKEKGVCEGFSDTKYSKGILPIDTYKKDIDEFITEPLHHDWESLRNDIVSYGLRNTTLTAAMPSETSSKTSNATNGIEPPRGYLSVKRKIRQIVPQYSTLKNNYTLLWDMKSNDGYFNIVSAMQKFFDQSISANWSYNPENYPDKKVPMSVVVNDFLSAYKKGHKTAYYMNTYDGKRDDMELEDLVNEILEEDEDDCDSCKI